MLLEDQFIDIQKKARPSLSIEIGAYEADFSKKMADLKICDQVYAYEASPYVYENFKSQLDGINYINLALTNYDGTAIFKIDSSKDPYTNTSDGLKIKRDVKNFNEIEVKCNRLDSLHNADNVCLWIDVEGAALEVLQGASGILKNVSSIYIETETAKYWKDQALHSDIVDFLAGYEIVFSQWQKQHTSQYNSIFINNKYLS